MKAREVAGDLAVKLTKDAGEIEDLRKQLDVALDRRDDHIVEADREGMTQRAIARLAKVSQPHVLRIVASRSMKAAG